MLFCIFLRINLKITISGDHLGAVTSVVAHLTTVVAFHPGSARAVTCNMAPAITPENISSKCKKKINFKVVIVPEADNVFVYFLCAGTVFGDVAQAATQVALFLLLLTAGTVHRYVTDLSTGVTLKFSFSLLRRIIRFDFAPFDHPAHIPC
jgi:hypothetical protein